MTNDQAAAFDYLTRHTVDYAHLLGYGDLKPFPHARWLRSIILGREDETLQAHRGAYKTTCLAVGLPIIMMMRGDQTLMFFRKTDTDVREVIRQTARNLQHPVTGELFRMLTDGCALELPTATGTAITTNAYTAPRGAAQLTGMGIGGSVTGKHADVIFTDDIVNKEDRASPAAREQTRVFYQELQNIRNPGGRILNTGTPWHPDDAFALMPKASVYDCYTTGLLGTDKLEQLRQSMSPSLFAANYELRHIAAEDALFPEAPKFTDDADQLRDGIAHIDASYGGEDFTALTCARRVEDTIYAYGRMWHGHVDTARASIEADMERLMCAPCYMETNGDKGYLSRELRADGVPTRPYHEAENKYTKIATWLRKWWPRIVWLRGTDPDYLAQIAAYTDTAEHDDAPDSAACVCRILDRRGG